MRIGRFSFNEARCNGYKLILDWPNVVSISHDNRGTIMPYSHGASQVTVCLFGGVNGGGRVWRFENYKSSQYG